MARATDGRPPNIVRRVSKNAKRRRPRTHYLPQLANCVYPAQKSDAHPNPVSPSSSNYASFSEGRLPINPAREKLESIDSIFKHTACVRLRITCAVRAFFVLRALRSFEKKFKCCIIIYHESTNTQMDMIMFTHEINNQQPTNRRKNYDDRAMCCPPARNHANTKAHE